ncbi:ribosomal large subunit pseudouridine synthase C [Oceanococcus atlanticus]|uniref:Pseudouridine synthase n=1 Tax=Oceanococcus atlanticus TaxID=1317117 RepID=A0A1Y1SFL1_9GAMM|nr:RluA family pseudouridine synthase [Oceanococcus atlanticus]ORE88443.1 ribosomal large subunit pseudouridine synthase C [Oceanococcus atlanticus]
MPQNIAKVSYLSVGEDETGQRLDNWLLARLKGVPKSRIYRIIRSGEVRVNKGRAKPSSRLAAGDSVRVPPVRRDTEDHAGPVPDGMTQTLSDAVLYRDDDVLVVNKPAGMAVHAGSGVRFGLIDAARALWGERWQLVHRLDRETSGCLLLVARRELQHEFQRAHDAGSIRKQYQSLVHGRWSEQQCQLESRLGKYRDGSGERRVASGDDAPNKRALTYIDKVQWLRATSLLEIRIETGRMHQIRVQTADAGHPVVGDAKYGRRALDAALELPMRPGLCLHACALQLELGGRSLDVSAPLPESFEAVITAQS